LSFKSDTDDVRASVSIKVVQALRGMGAQVRVYDPAGQENARRILGENSIYYAKDIYDSMKGAHAVCLLTEWKQFGELDLDKVKSLVAEKVIFDGRNLLDKEAVEKAGIKYYKRRRLSPV